MQCADELDWMLEEAKKHPHTIHHDFDTRIRVWIDQILPDRLHAIQSDPENDEYKMRMMTLILEDAQRLLDRADRETIRRM